MTSTHEGNNFTPLRLLLASLVMLAHFRILTGAHGAIWPTVYPDFAVDGFFIISGFLIYDSFDRRPETGSFFVRRFLRLYPLYLTVVLAQAALLLALQPDGAIPHAGEALRYILANAVFLNFIKNSIGTILVGLPDTGFNPSLWTLKVEVAFYLVVPLIWLGVQRFGTRWIVAGFAISLLYTTTLRISGHETLSKQLPGAMAYFFAGILLCIYRREIRVPTSLVLIAAAIGLVGVTCVQMSIGPFGNEFWRVFFPFMVIPGIYALTFRVPLLNLKRDISYGVYLIHGPTIQTLVVLSVIDFSLQSIGLVISIVVALALLVEWLIERPFIKLGQTMTRRAPHMIGGPHA